MNLDCPASDQRHPKCSFGDIMLDNVQRHPKRTLMLPH